MRKKYFCKWLQIVTGCLIFHSCTPVKEYKKQYLNDAEMRLSLRKSEKFESNFQSYREGASGANKSKTGGGCGCN
ncbi:MAG: hypothetical protein JWM28_1898 [Chitinophagaceae bacterium]|nr:hypothetical protein [Chitinophagaceae bacterium]